MYFKVEVSIRKNNELVYIINICNHLDVVCVVWILCR